jgi:putative transposase
MSRRLEDMRLAAMMIDGLELQGRTNVVALGITTEGVKIPLGLWEGSTENATVATGLLADLVERGLDPEQGILFVIDGAKSRRKAIRNVFGDAPVQRCVRHYADSPASSIAATPAPPARCAKGWRKRSPSPGSASTAR